MNTFHKIGFIGLGLIGGSIAKAIKLLNNTPSTIVAYDQDYASLVLAKKDGIVDQISTSIDEFFYNCDLIFICTPIPSNKSILKSLHPFLSNSTLLTDVGSVKKDIHCLITQYGLSKQSIGSNPLIGSVKNGSQHSSHRLLEKAVYIISTTNEGIAIAHVRTSLIFRHI